MDPGGGRPEPFPNPFPFSIIFIIFFEISVNDFIKGDKKKMGVMERVANKSPTLGERSNGCARERPGKKRWSP